MGWWRRMFGRNEKQVAPAVLAPQDIALNATLADLRRVASELQQTNRAFAERVEVLKETPRAKPARRTRAT